MWTNLHGGGGQSKTREGHMYTPVDYLGCKNEFDANVFRGNKRKGSIRHLIKCLGAEESQG